MTKRKPKRFSLSPPKTLRLCSWSEFLINCVIFLRDLPSNDPDHVHLHTSPGQTPSKSGSRETPGRKTLKGSQGKGWKRKEPWTGLPPSWRALRDRKWRKSVNNAFPFSKSKVRSSETTNNTFPMGQETLEWNWKKRCSDLPSGQILSSPSHSYTIPPLFPFLNTVKSGTRTCRFNST